MIKDFNSTDQTFRGVMLIVMAVLLSGCDSTPSPDVEASALSGTWATALATTVSPSGQAFSWKYVLDLTVAEDGSFTAVLGQEVDGTMSPDAQNWRGDIEPPAIRVISTTPVRAGSASATIDGFSGTASSRSITFDGARFTGYPGDELRFFPVE